MRACRLAKGRSVWLQFLAAVHERILLQQDVDAATERQNMTMHAIHARADESAQSPVRDSPAAAQPASATAGGEAATDAGHKRKRVSKGLGSSLRAQVSALSQTSRRGKSAGT
jgi:hypothetical protein